MLRPWSSSIVRIGALVGLSLTLSCQQEAANAAVAAAAPIRTGTVEAGQYTPRLEISGSLDPVASVQLGFDVPGRIQQLYVARGAAVSVGQSIARLDSRIASSQLAQAEAALAGARAQLAAGERALARLEQVRATGFVSDQQFDEVKAQVEAGRAGVQQAEAATRMARTNVEMHTLKSPIAGVVTNGPDSPGMLVGAGTPLFFVEDLGALQIKGSAAEGDGWVKEGMKATLQTGEVGEVLRVLPALDPVTRRIPVEMRFAPTPNLRAHAYARATIEGPPTDCWRVPAGAVVARPEFSVFVLTDGQPSRVPVTVAAEEGGTRCVLVQGAASTPLTAGSSVVIAPPIGYGES